MRITKLLYCLVLFASSLAQSTPSKAVAVPNNGCCVTISCCQPGGGDEESACTMTPISETGFSYTITQPGSYCLATDLEHELIIASNSVIVYMKGHAIHVPMGAIGVSVNALVIDFRLTGGSVDGQGAGGNIGISVLGSSDVRIEDVTCVGCSTGILLNNATTNTVLARVQCSVNEIGLEVQDAVGTVVVDSSFNENGVGVVANGSVSCVMKGCSAHANSNGDGFSGIALESCEFLNCIASNNDGSGFAFADASTDVVVRGCVASGNNDSGFEVIDVSADITFLHSVAENNGASGFSVDGSDAIYIDCRASFNGAGGVGDGFTFVDSTILVRGCTAENNDAYGFNTDDVANQFYSNVACNNGVANYNGVASAPVTSAYNMRGVQNVDCENNAPDTVDIITGEVNNGCGCSVTVLSVDQSTTLTVPGRYCLAVDFTNQITINGDSITLDLNSHSISVSGGLQGIVVNAGLTDVRIKNGFIIGDGATTPVGIVVGAAADVRISDVSCSNFSSGIDVSGAQRVVISQVIAHQNSTHGIRCVSCSDVFLSQCQCSGSAIGIVFDGSERFCIRECAADNNNVGISVVAGSTNGEIVNCFVNTNALVGVEIDSSSYIVIRECTAHGAGIAGSSRGYTITDGLAFIANSIASGCDKGFFISATLNNAVVMRECSAVGNNVGFENNAASPCFFYASDACNNGTNFVSVSSAPVTGADCSTYWNNVDCTAVCP